MKKINKYFLSLFALSFLFISCRDFKEAECTGVKGFKINSVSPKGLNADIMLGIKNPNNMGFSVYPSEFEVVFNGMNLGWARSSKRVHIEGNSEKVYTFTLKSDFKNLNPMDILRLVNSGSDGMIRVKGNIKAGKFYLKKKFPIDVKQKVG